LHRQPRIDARCIASRATLTRFGLAGRHESKNASKCTAWRAESTSCAQIRASEPRNLVAIASLPGQTATSAGLGLPRTRTRSRRTLSKAPSFDDSADFG